MIVVIVVKYEFHENGCNIESYLTCLFEFITTFITAFLKFREVYGSTIYKMKIAIKTFIPIDNDTLISSCGMWYGRFQLCSKGWEFSGHTSYYIACLL